MRGLRCAQKGRASLRKNNAPMPIEISMASACKQQASHVSQAVYTCVVPHIPVLTFTFGQCSGTIARDRIASHCIPSSLRAGSSASRCRQHRTQEGWACSKQRKRSTAGDLDLGRPCGEASHPKEWKTQPHASWCFANLLVLCSIEDSSHLAQFITAQRF